MKYKNFIFDMGNVILDFSPDYLLSKYTGDVTIIRTLKEELFYSGLWHRLDNDDVSLDEMYEIVRDRIPNYMHPVLLRYLKDWSFNLFRNEDMENLVLHLKEKGYGIYLCSNAPSFFRKMNAIYPILNLFDGIVFSGEIGLSKPDPKIFEYLLDRYGLKSEECFFIDDLLSNIQAGINCGIDGYQFNGNHQLFKIYLENIGVI